jgi:hypothetical protein
MNTQNYLIDALETVLGWGLPDEVLPLALVDEAHRMAGFDYEAGYDWELAPESFVSLPH